MAFIEELIARAASEAEADPEWLGSEEQLAFLTDSLPNLGVNDARLAWAPPGRGANWERVSRTIEIERIVSGAIPVTDEVIATMTVRTVLHESLHARYSTSSSLNRRLSTEDPRLVEVLQMICNFLEDSRVAKLALAAEPELAGVITEHMNDAADQLDARSGTSGSGSEPADQRNQLVFAAMAYVLVPNRDLVLHPDVSTALESLRPIIDKARDGPSTETTVHVGFEIVARIMRYRPAPPSRS